MTKTYWAVPALDDTLIVLTDDEDVAWEAAGRPDATGEVIDVLYNDCVFEVLFEGARVCQTIFCGALIPIYRTTCPWCSK